MQPISYARHRFHAADRLVALRLTVGHHEFCESNPKECAIRTQSASPEQISEAFLKRIAEVNLTVNQSVKPMSDLDLFVRRR